MNSREECAARRRVSLKKTYEPVKRAMFYHESCYFHVDESGITSC